ncbi:hypothetical protein QJS66_15570 [Kocuria rhizophila]|nr:hypothetical protein QJS66_15570 [Kocuria rhizophila]
MDLVLDNGLHLEQWLQQFTSSANVALQGGLRGRGAPDRPHPRTQPARVDEPPTASATWTNIVAALSELDGEHAQQFRTTGEVEQIRAIGTDLTEAGSPPRNERALVTREARSPTWRGTPAHREVHLAGQRGSRRMQVSSAIEFVDRQQGCPRCLRVHRLRQAHAAGRGGHQRPLRRHPLRRTLPLREACRRPPTWTCCATTRTPLPNGLSGKARRRPRSGEPASSSTTAAGRRGPGDRPGAGHRAGGDERLGKSTLLRRSWAPCAWRPARRRLDGLDPRTARKRGVVGYVPQSEDVDWAFPLCVRDVVMTGRYGDMGPTRRARPGGSCTAVADALERVEATGAGRAADRAGRPRQRKRVFVARAIARARGPCSWTSRSRVWTSAARRPSCRLLHELAAQGCAVVVATHALARAAAARRERGPAGAAMCSSMAGHQGLAPEHLVRAFGLDVLSGPSTRSPGDDDAAPALPRTARRGRG